MRISKLLPVALMATLLLASCGKEDLDVVVEEVPVVEPEIVVIEQSSFRVSGNTFTVDSVGISPQQDFGSNDLTGYALVATSSDINSPGVYMNLTWTLDSPELNIQETTYTAEQAQTVSQDYIDAIQVWMDAGSDPNTIPIPELEEYDASGVSVTVSNVILAVDELDFDVPDPNDPTAPMITITLVTDQADIQVSGNLIDGDGVSIPISGSFAGFANRIEF